MYRFGVSRLYIKHFRSCLYGMNNGSQLEFRMF